MISIAPEIHSSRQVGAAFRAAPTEAAEIFRLLVDSVQDYAIFMLDISGRILTWNPGAERIKGYSVAEAIGLHFSVFYPPEDVAANKPATELKVAAAEGRAADEGWRVRKDGSRFWANAVITALRSETGELLGFTKVTRDLTEQRQAAEALRRSEERFRLLIEGVEDYAIYMLDPDGNVTTWNSGAKRIKGYEPHEIMGRSYAAFFTPEDVAARRPQLELATARETGHFEEEGWRVRKDGTRFWANVVLTALRDSKGELVGFAKVTRDLTARKQAEDVARELVREQAARGAAEEAEGRLRDERERYKALSRRLEVILEAIADGITVQDRSGAIIFANTAAAKLSGFESVEAFLSADPAQIIGRFDLLDEQGQPFDLRNLPGRRVFDGERIATASLRVRERASGREFWTAVRSSPVLNDDGRAELAVNVLHDVSLDRQREEHERHLANATATLSSSLDYEAMLRALASELVPGFADWCSIHLLDGSELKSVAVSHADPARLAQVREYEQRHPPDPKAARGVWHVLTTGQYELYPRISEEPVQERAWDEEQLRSLRELGARSVIIAPICVRNQVRGTISLVSAESGRRYQDADARLAEELGRRAGTAIDNARLYSAERRARQQVELIARAGESFSGTLDYDATLLNVVNIVLPVLGDFVFFDVVESGDVRRIAQAHDDPLADEWIKQTKWVSLPSSGEPLCALSSGSTGFHPHIDEAWFEHLPAGSEQLVLLRQLELRSLVTVPMKARGELLGSLTICFGKSGRNYTIEDVRLVEELARRASVAVVQARLFGEARAAAKAAAEAARVAEEASRVKDEFLATVSHELRTPLNAILGWSGLLREKGQNPDATRAFEVIYRNAQSQSKIIEDILDVSRIVTGKLRLELKPADLVLVVSDAIDVVRPSAAAKRIALSFEPPRESCLLVADPERLQQVVWNLLSNAVKFTNAGGTVDVIVGRDGSNLVVTIRDDGKGISEEFLPYVFDRFKQADSSTTRKIGGLGLGLAIVRHIVELHGGQVSAASAGLGKGATFTITLPVRAVAPSAPPPAEPHRAPSVTALSGAARLAGLKVLVVDDEADARDLLRKALLEAGAVVEIAGSSAEAYDLLLSFRPDVLVSDLGMPDEDGFELMRRIRALAPGLGGDLPSMALSAYARVEDRTKALAVGFTTHMSKPVNPNELLDAISNLARFGPRSPS
jgi:PAS domain S-box-containing protein